MVRSNSIHAEENTCQGTAQVARGWEWWAPGTSLGLGTGHGPMSGPGSFGPLAEHGGAVGSWIWPCCSLTGAGSDGPDADWDPGPLGP